MKTIADADMFAMLMIFSSVLQAPKLMPRKLRRQCTISLKMSFVWNYRKEKTLITNASSQAAKFLGYEIKAQRANDYIDPKGRRGANGAIRDYLFLQRLLRASVNPSAKWKGYS